MYDVNAVELEGLCDSLDGANQKASETAGRSAGSVSILISLTFQQPGKRVRGSLVYREIKKFAAQVGEIRDFWKFSVSLERPLLS